MKFTERTSGLYLEDVVGKDVRFSNLGGRMTGSPYDDPERPKHYIVLWIPEELVETFVNMNVKVTSMSELDRVMNGRNEERKEEVAGNPELQKELGEWVRYCVTLKAYPKLWTNYRTDKTEQRPLVIMKTTGNSVRLNADQFGLVDSAHIDAIDIKFHTWQYNDRKPDCVAVIDELYVTVDESAGELDDSYLAEKHGYSEEEEIPFA